MINFERTNLADLSPLLVPEEVEVICMDLSYLALAGALPQLRMIGISPNAQLIALVKPTP